jgi:hypothetical protein
MPDPNPAPANFRSDRSLAAAEYQPQTLIFVGAASQSMPNGRATLPTANDYAAPPSHLPPSVTANSARAVGPTFCAGLVTGRSTITPFLRPIVGAHAEGGQGSQKPRFNPLPADGTFSANSGTKKLFPVLLSCCFVFFFSEIGPALRPLTAPIVLGHATSRRARPFEH